MPRAEGYHLILLANVHSGHPRHRAKSRCIRPVIDDRIWDTFLRIIDRLTAQIAPKLSSIMTYCEVVCWGVLAKLIFLTSGELRKYGTAVEVANCQRGHFNPRSTDTEDVTPTRTALNRLTSRTWTR